MTTQIRLKRPPLKSQELTLYAVSHGYGYVVLRTASSLQMLIDERQELAQTLRQLADELEPVTAAQTEVSQ